MRKFWLLFSQSATIALGVLLVITIFKPEWRVWHNTAGISSNILNANPVAPGSYRYAANKAIPSVVNIFTSKAIRTTVPPISNNPLFNHFFGGQAKSRTQRVSNLGSGVIVSPNGYILTNHHVVESADEIQVALHDGRTLMAKVVGTDPETDLAVLKIDATHLPAITFSQSDQASIGDVVLAIGDPFGVGQTVTMGIISALGRSHLGINTFEDFIQTDAAINPGNSGGPLVDTNGNLIGINSAIYSRTGGSQGIGFAIPANLVAIVMKQIIEHGEVIRGWMGIEVQDLTPELAESFKLKNDDGALIAGILRGGPADRANIHPGDVLLSVDNQTVTDSSALLNQIAALKPGQKTNIKLLHRDKLLTTTVTIARRPRLETGTENTP
jgi:serine protease DegQ